MSSVQPQWITPAGSLGTIPENIFYRINLSAEAGDQDVFFRLIAGELPAGIQVTSNGALEGVPKTLISVQGVPQEVSEDVTSRFAIRAFTRRSVNGQLVVDRLADRTFEITVSGQNLPVWITPAGNIGTFYDATQVEIPLEFSDPDPDDEIRFEIVSGQLPPGLFLDTRTGVIKGVISPVIGPPDTAAPGFDSTPNDIFPNDFTTRAASRNFEFALGITDGKETNIRTFTIFVYARNTLSADNTSVTADNTFVTADVTPSRTPILLTPPGSLGIVRADNYYAFKFDAIDFDGDALEFSIGTGIGVGFDESLFDQNGIGFDRGSFALPPGLEIDQDTGWFYGYIPDQGSTEFTYTFTISVAKKLPDLSTWSSAVAWTANSLVEYNDEVYQSEQDVPIGIDISDRQYWWPQPTVRSDPSFFDITILGDLDTEVTWLTSPDLGSIDNGAISNLSVRALNTGGRTIEYRLSQGIANRLPQGLTLLPSGNIVGRVSFNTFALDGGTTTFDLDRETRMDDNATTFDLEFDFTVNAFSPEAQQIGYEVTNIVITNPGSGYTSQPTVTIGPPSSTVGSIQATAGVVTITGGTITNIAVGNPGRGYTAPPTITISGGGGAGAVAVAQIREVTLINPVSVFRRFSLRVNRRFNEPYETLYIKAMPPQQDRDQVENLLLNQDIIPTSLVYRADDPNFGVAQSITYAHAYGLTASTIQDYVSALNINHYLKDLVLGPIETAQALDSNGNVVYEVVYSRIIDNLVNSAGQSVAKQITWPVPIEVGDDSSQITVVYPNSLINMRNQVIDSVGQVSPALPLWMTSKQVNGQVLGFTPAWVIAYAQPGQSDRIAYNIRTLYGPLNAIDFEVDRYIIDRSQTLNWNPESMSWIPSPPTSTLFDDDTTIFDADTVTFNAPADRWEASDRYDKYLVFPRRNILG